MRRGPVSPNNVLEKKQEVRMLGKVCGQLASASELNLEQSGARAGASRGRVVPIPPFENIIRGVYPPLTIALFFVLFGPA